MVSSRLLFVAIVAALCPKSLALSSTNEFNRREWLQTTSVLSFLPILPHAAVASDTSKPYLTKEYYTPGDTLPEAGRTFFPALTPPFTNRATYRYSLGRDAWALEQLLTFANVMATIRSNVILLRDGSLFVHSPQYPTGECCALLEQLGHPVKHIVLPCNALEHKAPVKAFTKRFPDASVWISPGQYGPFGSCGMTLSDPCNMGYRVDGILGPGNPPPPWADEFEIATLYAELPENAGPVSEVAFCHVPSRTLIATDAVVYIPSGPPPAILSTYFDEATLKQDSFWPKSVLQAVFLPLRQDAAGNYPGYEALRERLVRAPILRAFCDARAPDQGRDWVKQISTWDFDRIITSHFASPVAATPRDFSNAFAYLFDSSLDKLPPIACQDWQLLESLNQGIASTKLGAPIIFDYQRGCIE